MKSGGIGHPLLSRCHAHELAIARGARPTRTGPRVRRTAAFATRLDAFWMVIGILVASY